MINPAADLLKFDIDKWEGDTDVYFNANCYNYALDVVGSKYSGNRFIPSLNPGELMLRRTLWPDERKIRKALKKLKDPESLLQKMFDPKRFEHYQETRISSFIQDGLQYLGTETEFPGGGYPVALFLRGIDKDSMQWFNRMDYHWYALRKDETDRPFWACKFRNSGVKILHDESIFTDALNGGYDHFAGYFLRPNDLDV